MSKSTKIIIGIIVVFILVWASYALLRQRRVSSGPIQIGFIGPLSGDGAAWGEEQKYAMDIAVEEINGKGGVNGRTLSVIYEDGKCDGKTAATAAQKLISVDSIRILMPVCSAESLAVAPIAEQNKVLEFAVWPTNPTYSGIGTYTFRNSYSDDDTGKVMASTIGAKFSRVGIITELTDYPVGLRDAFKKYFRGDMHEEGYQPGSRDLRTQAAKILSKNPEAILLNPNSPLAGLAALEQLRALGYKGQFYGNFFGSSGDVLKSKAAEGMIFFADPAVPENTMKGHLLDEYQKRFGTKPDFEFAVAAQYDSVYILKQAIEAVGPEPDKLKDYLHSLKNFTGVLGTYGFNEKGDVIGYLPSVKQIKDGMVGPYTEKQ